MTPRELLACPFCGMSVTEIVTGDQINDCETCTGNFPFYTVVCDAQKKGCGATCGYWIEGEAEEQWNRRAIAAGQSAQELILETDKYLGGPDCYGEYQDELIKKLRDALRELV